MVAGKRKGTVGQHACLCQGCVENGENNENDLCSTTEGEDTTDESSLSIEEYTEEEIITEDQPVFDTCYDIVSGRIV